MRCRSHVSGTGAVSLPIVLITLLATHSASAQLRGPDPNDPPLANSAGAIVAEGDGYQLVEIDMSDLSDVDAVSDETDQPVAAPAGTRRTWAFTSMQGIQSAPIPELLRADLMEDAAAQPFAADGELPMMLMDEEAAQRAMAAQEEVAPEPVEGPQVPGPQSPDQESFGLCSKKKKRSSKTQTIDLTPSGRSRPVSLAGFTGELSADAQQRGQVTIKVNYVKKSRCGIPYGVDVESVEVSGNVDLTGSELKLSGTVAKFEQTHSVNLLNLQRTFSFFAGPILIIIQPGLRVDAALKLKAEVQAQVGVRSTINGRYSFAYNCTTRTCTELRPVESFLEAAPDPVQPIGSVSARVQVKPSVNVAAQTAVYLYVKSFAVARAEIGVNVGVPAELWLYAGNTCGDGDGDGVNETVDAVTLDLNTDLYAYAELNGSTRSIDLKLSSPWEKLTFDGSQMGSRERDTYRRNIYFKDLASGGSSALSPLVVSAPSVPQQGNQLTLRGRPCVPFYGQNLDYVVDFGGEGTQTITGPKAGHSITRNWASPGPKPLSVSIARDSLRRDINGRATRRTITVEGAAAPPPPPPAQASCMFDGKTVAHGASVVAFRGTTTLPCESCEAEQRTCNNGTLSGSYTFARCTPRRLRPGEQCP